MTDYIKAAAELADGWTYHDGDCSHEETERWFIGCKLPQVWKDALAAQLTRQVDAISEGHCVAVTELQTIVYFENTGSRIKRVIGPDRTMSTIKAIVDSGALK